MRKLWLVLLLLTLTCGEALAQAYPTHGVVVHTLPPGAHVQDVTDMFNGLQHVWDADGMPYPIEYQFNHHLRITQDGYQAADVDVTIDQLKSDPVALPVLELTPLPATWLHHQLTFHRARTLTVFGLGALVLSAVLGSLVGAHLRKTRQLEAQLSAAELQRRDLTGQIVDDYQLMAKVGEGAFSEVYRVEHVQFRDPWAMKLLKTDMADGEIHTRFFREMQAGRDLRHPNLVRVHAFGQFHHQPYIVMEYLQGQTLGDLLVARGRLEPAEAVRLFTALAEGIAFAHQQKVVHRDLKPENIMLLPDGTLRIMDFGIAKFMGQDKITTTGTFLGTPAYMSPEHLNAAGMDYRADIYSAGIILYELLTGAPPFQGEDVLKVMFAHAQDTPAPLHVKVPDIPSELEAVVMRMLEKKPEDRFQSMEDVLASLKPIPSRVR